MIHHSHVIYWPMKLMSATSTFLLVSLTSHCLIHWTKMSKRTAEVVGDEVTACYLSQFQCLIPGLWAGVFFGRKYKTYTPLILGITIGTAMDHLYARCFGCKKLQDEYDYLVQREKTKK